MNLTLPMKVTALAIFSLAFLISLFLIVTSWSLATIIMVAIIVAATGVVPFAFGWNEALYSKWPWMKNGWFVVAQRILAVCVIAIALYVLISGD